MSHRATAHRLLAMLAVTALAVLASAPSSGAAVTPWGDLGHFGELKSEINTPEPAFGVDPKDGSVWVVDTVEEGGVEKFRLQRFEQGGGGSWSVVASRVLESNTAPNGTNREVEGIAFDTSEERAYLLVTEERKAKASETQQVAAELWAFSTVKTGSTIEPATGTTNGVLVPRTEANLTGTPVGKKEFAPDAKEKGATLSAPGGIAVNSTNNEVLITGWVGKEGENKEEVEVWAVSEKGEIKTVWEDETKYFEKCGCLGSPVVTSSGKILVLGETQEIVELPSTLDSKTAPKTAFFLPHFIECEVEKDYTCTYLEELTFVEDGEEGGGLTIGPNGDIYLHIALPYYFSKGDKENSGGVMVLDPSLQEVGWTGGGAWGSATKECAVNEKALNNDGPALLGAGEHGVFMFERGLAENDEHAKVLELGPGGDTANCPHASATKPVAESGGSKPASFPISDHVNLSSEMLQANAVSSEWEFGDGTSETVSTRQQEQTLVSHQFKEAGSLDVKEKIHTDDLATPEIETSETVTLVAPLIQGEQATPEGSTEVALKAEINPRKSLTKCEFQVAEVGKSLSEGIKSACAKTIEKEELITETAKVSGLTAGKCYVFRLEAKAGVWESNQTGTEFNTGATCSGAAGPSAETKPATEIKSTSAKLNGMVDPKGVETKSCTFEYGTSAVSEKTKPCATSPGSGTTSVAVSAEVTGLTPGTGYKVELIDESTESKKAEGGQQPFTTLAASQKPSVEELGAASVTQTTATLKANVNPHGETTTCEFEYGSTAISEHKGACPVSPGSGSGNVEEALAVTGLTPSTSYHYRVKATNGTGTTEGAESEFKTLAAPVVETKPASEVGSTTATLNGTVNPEGVETKSGGCVFDYGSVTVTEKTAACSPAPGDGGSAVAVSAKVTGLTASTPYKFKLIDESTEGKKGEGGEQPFTTLAASQKPSVEELGAASVTQTTATLKANVNPHGESTTCEFEYGSATISEHKKACQISPGSGTGNVEEALAVTGLTPSTSYHYRVKATSNAGTTEGAESEWKTLAAAAPGVEDLVAGSVTQTTATLMARVNPHGEATTCQFEYGTSTSYGTTVPCPTSPGAESVDVEEVLPLTGLAAGTTYHFRVTAKGAAHTTPGADIQFTTEAEPAPAPPNNTGGSTNNGGGGETPKGGVEPEKVTNYVPIVTVAGSAMTVAANGGFSLKLSCPSAETSCAGTVTVKTLSAVATSSAHKAKKTILTLATGSFTITAGQLKALSLHLTAKARQLLAKLHTIRARVTIVAHDPQGHTHTTSAILTLKAAKKKH